ncbi:MAG TPA: hypothetical protein VK308_11205 [Pyrinomonadaceae bacterium]|nr:hypothetical protein [Pyrinomonadaceae bacterium]
MNLKLSLILIVFCALASQAQKVDDKARIAAQQIILKKQIVVDDLDSQAKNVPLAAARIFARLKIVEWLWKDGKDDTGRAESIAVKAIEELYEKKNEIPNSIHLSAPLFAMLELNAKDSAKKLKAKYKIEAQEDLSNASYLLNKEGGDKILAAKIKQHLTNGNDLYQISYLIGELRDRKSQEVLAILAHIITLEENGGNSFPAGALFNLTDYFREQTVPIDLKTRFYRIILGKARDAVQLADGSIITSADRLLYAVLPDINQNASELSGEAMALKSILSAKTSQLTKESRERDERIKASDDKLAALISEAEKADSKNVKRDLYDDAGLLATKQEKFQLAADLYGKALENIANSEKVKPEILYGHHDHQLNEIVKAALAKDDVESAEYATKKIIGEFKKAEALRQTAIYSFENKDSGTALNNYDEALKLVAKQENTGMKFYMLFRLIPAAQTIDPDRVSETTAITAKAIDNFPTLNPEDKPGTEKFNEYTSTIMAINYNVNQVMRDLIKKNKSEADDFANRINRKEVKIIANVVLAINQFETEKKQVNAK